MSAPLGQTMYVLRVVYYKYALGSNDKGYRRPRNRGEIMPTCLYCGAEIPEGRQICPICENTKIIGVDRAAGVDTYRRVIAVDFDGTLCVNHFPDIGEPIRRTIQYIKRERACGSFIILWTCRQGERLTAAVDWCKRQGLIFDYINENTAENIAKYGGDTRKINADIYIDDKAADIDSLIMAAGRKNEIR